MIESVFICQTYCHSTPHHTHLYYTTVQGTGITHSGLSHRFRLLPVFGRAVNNEQHIIPKHASYNNREVNAKHTSSPGGLHATGDLMLAAGTLYRFPLPFSVTRKRAASWKTFPIVRHFFYRRHFSTSHLYCVLFGVHAVTKVNFIGRCCATENLQFRMWS